MGFKEEKEMKLKKRYENNLKKRRYSTLNNNLKEHYREINNHIYQQKEHEYKMRAEFKELITRIEKQFKNLRFIGAFESIQEYNENIDGKYSFDELINTCFDDDEIIFTLAGNLTIKQSGDLTRKLSIFPCEKYEVKNIEYHRFIFSFNNYFQAYLGREYIEPYQVRRVY